MEKTRSRLLTELLSCVVLHFLFLWLMESTFPSLAVWVRPLSYLLPAGVLRYLSPKEKKRKRCDAKRAVPLAIAVFGGACLWTIAAYALQRLLSVVAVAQAQTWEVLFTAVTAAICEELFYRGALLDALRVLGQTKRMPHLAIGASALLFALWHPFPCGSFFALGCGVMLGYLSLLCGGCRAAMAVHLCVNLTAFALLCAPLWVQMLCYGIGVAIGVAALLWFLCRKKEETKETEETEVAV